MGNLDGTVSITGLPPHRGLIVNLCFYEVDGPDAPAPYDGDPPAAAGTDSQKIAEYVHLEEESRQSTFEQRFSIEHRTGYYYVQVRVILFREAADRSPPRWSRSSFRAGRWRSPARFAAISRCPCPGPRRHWKSFTTTERSPHGRRRRANQALTLVRSHRPARSACVRARRLRGHGTHFCVRKSMFYQALMPSVPSACHVPRLSGPVVVCP